MAAEFASAATVGRHRAAARPARPRWRDRLPNRTAIKPERRRVRSADTYVVQRGNSLWRIARQVYGNGARYTEIHRANQDLIPDPARIYPGQQFKVPKS